MTATGRDQEPYDGRGFDEWYVEEWPRVVALVRTVTLDLEAAEDIAAGAFYKAYARWSRLDNPSGWIRTVALNAAKRHPRRPTMASAPAREALDPRASTDMALVEVVDLLSALSTKQREVVALRYLYDLTQAQIAEELSIAPGTVAATLSTARRKLGHQLPHEEFRHVR